jgi:hypothetical protein
VFSRDKFGHTIYVTISPQQAVNLSRSLENGVFSR